MTATDVTGFWAFFSAWKSGNFHISGRFPCSFTHKTWRKRKNIHYPLAKFQKVQVEKFPRNCRFLSLVVVERVLKIHWKIHCKIQIRIRELRGQNPHPHCQDLPLTFRSHIGSQNTNRDGNPSFRAENRDQDRSPHPKDPAVLKALPVANHQLPR